MQWYLIPHHDKESVLLPFHPIWWMSDQPCHRSPSTQAAQYCRLFWICLEQTITLCLRLNTARFPAYLIAECSSFLVIWWHTPVMAYVFAVMLLHKLQWELNKNHWLFLLLVLSTGGKACLSFSLFFHLSILSFTKRSCKCFFCTGYWWIKAPGFVTALIAAVCEGSAVQSSSHRYGGSAGDIEMEKQRPRKKTHAFFGQILPCCEQRIQRLQFLMDSYCRWPPVALDAVHILASSCCASHTGMSGESRNISWIGVPQWKCDLLFLAKWCPLLLIPEIQVLVWKAVQSWEGQQYSKEEKAWCKNHTYVQMDGSTEVPTNKV